MAEAVKVLVRCRPMNEREQKLKCEVVIQMDPKITQVQLHKPSGSKEKIPPKTFTFDGVYYTECNTQQIYEEMCFSLVSGVLEGYNGTVFAYGQTGCGKSFSMMGVQDPPVNRGVIPRAFEHVFDHVAVTNNVKFLVRASYLEIYNEEVRDLLGKDAKRKLDLHEHPDKGVYVQGLSMHKVHNVVDLEKVMELGGKNRSVGATLMNVDSSRSHSIFSIEVEMLESSSDGEDKLRVGKLNLVDLAGSERQSKTGSTGERLKEATKINLSLSALGNVISALVDGKSKHIPYRDSKLTRLLQSSLGGNTKTLMIACVSPADNNYDETLSTLRYANRAKNIKNKPKINEDPKDALLREYQEEIKKLKMMLMGQMGIPTDLQGDSSSVMVAPRSAAPGQQQSSEVLHDTSGVEEEGGGHSEDLWRKWEEEKEAMRRGYEARIAELQEQFGREQADRERLQEELDELQREWDEQLDEAQDQFNMTMKEVSSKKLSTKPPISPEGSSRQIGRSGTPVAAILTEDTEADHETTEASLEEPVSAGYMGTDKNREVLRDHEAAVKRLEELQRVTIGGEKADNETLRKHLDERRQVAIEREANMKEANSLFDEDGSIERIFNDITEEVKVKTHHIERLQLKVRSVEDDIKDLYSEFEIERQDYLDTIREQEKRFKLCEQLLQTVVPCLRRDCNYFNIDKIKDECTWNDDQSQWLLPKLIVTKSNLTSINSKVSVLEKRPVKQGSSPDVRHRGLHSATVSASMSHDPQEEDSKLLSHLQKFSGQSEYFKPKRQLELLGQAKESSSPEHSNGLPGLDSSFSSKKGGSTISLQSSAAAVHGITGDPVFNRRHGKLQSLPGGKAPLPALNDSPSRSRQNIELLDKVEKRLSNRKRNSLEPLNGKKSGL